LATVFPPLNRDPDAGLVRALGLGRAVMLVIGSVLGSGIFLTTGVMAQHIPSASLLLLAWILGGILCIAGGLTLAELGAMYPRSGGLYVFLSEAYGPLFGFLYGWACFLVILSGAQAAVAVGFAEYFSYFFPALATTNILVSIPLPWGVLQISAGQVVACLVIVAIGLINFRGVATGSFVQSLCTFTAAAALAILPVLTLAASRVTPSYTPVLPEVPRVAVGFGVAMVAVMWTYEAWYYVAFASGEIKDPVRNVPRAMVLGILALMGLYVSVNLAYLYSLSIDEMSGVVRVAERAVTALVGDRGAFVVAATVCLSTFGCCAAGAISMSRACYAMAVDRVFIPAAANVHPRYRTPHVAIALTTAWAVLLTLSGTYEQLFTYVTFASLLFGVAGGVSIFILRWRKPDFPRPYRAWGYPWVPLFFVLGSLLLVVNTLLESPKESGAGLVLVALGLPAYFYWRK